MGCSHINYFWVVLLVKIKKTFFIFGDMDLKIILCLYSSLCCAAVVPNFLCLFLLSVSVYFSFFLQIRFSGEIAQMVERVLAS